MRARATAVPGALAGWARGLHGRTPLRVRLVAAVLLLVVTALLASGAAATAVMRSYLVGRVDRQLASVAEHPPDNQSGSSTQSGPSEHDGGNGGGGDRGRGLPSAFVTELTDASGTAVYGPTSDLVDSHLPLPSLPHPTAAQSKAEGTRYFTVRAVSGGGTWRVLSKPVTLTNGTAGTFLVAQSLGDVQNTVDRMELLLAVIGGATVVVLSGVGYLVVRVSLRPLRTVERTAARIAAGDLSRRVPDADPHTEVGQLSGAFNAMLTEIEAAFAARAASEEEARRSEERMRRFVADAGHELRTPLTSIRGFAELYRQGAVTEEAQIRRMMGRIEDEAKRMGLLVEELLLLARLDRERPLVQAPVDMLALADDAVHDARATDPDRPISLEVGPNDPPPVVIGDEGRLRQVLANLLSNALRHTPPGTPVTVRIATGVGEHPGEHTDQPVVTLEVADEGPGMTEETAARVFERFYRADPSRARGGGDGGSGLGLAIVSALVAAHGGSVDVRTAPGAGACFRVTLPLAGDGE